MVVVTIGRGGDRDRFGPQPGQVRIEQYVPQEQVLPHVDVVVCHAGAGTVLGSLAHGVPLVLSPLTTDQFDAAAQVAGAGAGVVAGPGEDGVREAFRRVRDEPGHRDAAVEIAARIGAMPSPEEVLGRLLAYG